MNEGLFFQFLTIFRTQLEHAALNLRPYVMILLTVLITLEILRKCWRVMIQGESPLQFVTLLIRTTILLEFLLDFPAYMSTMYDYAVRLGLLAGNAGMTFATFQDPGAILTEGFRITAILLQPGTSWTLFNIAIASLIAPIVWVGVNAAFALMAIAVFIAQAELILCVPILLLALIFAVCGFTAWMAQGVLSWMYRTGLRFLLFAMMSSLVIPLMQTITIQASSDATAMLLMLIGVWAIAILFVRLSGIATGIASGHPALHLSDGIQVGATALALGHQIGRSPVTQVGLATVGGVSREIGSSAALIARSAGRVLGPPVASAAQTLATLRRGGKGP